LPSALLIEAIGVILSLCYFKKITVYLLIGRFNTPTIKNAKNKVEEEAKKAAVDVKKLAENSRRIQKAGQKVAEETKKAASRLKNKI
jgi:hypothetical protein